MTTLGYSKTHPAQGTTQSSHKGQARVRDMTVSTQRQNTGATNMASHQNMIMLTPRHRGAQKDRPHTENLNQA